MSLTDVERTRWDEQGFFIVERFLPQATVEELQDRIVELAAAAASDEPIGDAIIVPEARLADAAAPEQRVSKIFKLHRNEPLFRAICEDPRLLDKVSAILGPNIDCFLSQFIFKHPGSLGQPWHQDQYYFRMEPSPQVGAWLAVTEAHMDNGPLWVAPGSHTEPIHEQVVRDGREGANPGYVEIQGIDTSSEVPVLMEPGDLLVFHSHLRHRSTDNESDAMRAAAVYHFAQDGTTTEVDASNQDWLPVLRSGQPA